MRQSFDLMPANENRAPPWWRRPFLAVMLVLGLVVLGLNLRGVAQLLIPTYW